MLYILYMVKIERFFEELTLNKPFYFLGKCIFYYKCKSLMIGFKSLFPGLHLFSNISPFLKHIPFSLTYHTLSHLPPPSFLNLPALLFSILPTSFSQSYPPLLLNPTCTPFPNPAHPLFSNLPTLLVSILPTLFSQY